MIYGILVRRIKAEDIPSVLRLFKAAFHREISLVGLDPDRLLGFRKYRFVIGAFYGLCDLLHIDFPTILVATHKDNVVGEVHLTPLGRRIWTIDSLAVDPSCSRRGVGFTLIKESVDYVAKRQAQKVISSMRTDNVPANKIAQKLGYRIFEERIVLMSKIGKLPKFLDNDVLTREAKPKDAKGIFEIARTTDSTKIKAFEITPEVFSDSLFQIIIDRITGTHSQKFVAETQDKIVAYGRVVYTSPIEAARIEPFYTPMSSDLPKVAGSLLSKTADYLSARKITRIITSVNAEHREAIETLTRLGFTPIANMYWYICLERSP
jgi:ribosomal protein S18 acetylase RimI-like enzyme